MTPSARVFHEMRELEGLKEIKGPEHEPLIVKMFAAVGHQWVKDDETAWCAACMGYVLHKAGMKHTGKLNARSYLELGEPIDLNDAEPGDILIFSRGDPNGWQGHVTTFVRRTSGGKILARGGNQGDMVKVSTYDQSRLLGVRKPVPLRKSVHHTETAKGLQKVAAGAGVGVVLEVIDTVNQMTAPAQEAVADPTVPAWMKLAAGAAIIGLIGYGLWRAYGERIKKFKAGDK